MEWTLKQIMCVLLCRVCIWCTTQCSSLTPTLWLCCCSASSDITSSAPPTTRRTCSGAQTAPAPSGAASQHTSSAPIAQLTEVSTAASSWPRASGECLVTSTTLVTWWVLWPTVLLVALATYCRTSTLSTWPSCSSTAVCATSTGAAASTARTGNATLMLYLTGWFLECFRKETGRRRVGRGRAEIWIYQLGKWSKLMRCVFVWLCVLYLCVNYTIHSVRCEISSVKCKYKHSTVF